MSCDCVKEKRIEKKRAPRVAVPGRRGGGGGGEGRESEPATTAPYFIFSPLATGHFPRGSAGTHVNSRPTSGHTSPPFFPI